MPANKNNSRHSSKSNPRVFGYGHKYKCLQISDMDMNTASGVKAAIRRLDFIDNELLYRPRAGNKKAKMKNKKALVITLTGACDDRLKELAKENLFPFIKAISDVSEKEVAQWMDEHMKATKISLTRLKFWRKSVGYSFGGILELIHEQSYGLGQELQTSVGEWNSLNRIYGKIMRGDWMFARENDDTSSDSSSNAWFDFLWSLKRYFAVITSKYRAFEENKFQFTRQRSSARKDRCRALKNIWSVFDRLDRSKPEIVWQYLETLYLCWEDEYDAVQQKLNSLS
eukprot:639461_1